MRVHRVYHAPLDTGRAVLHGDQAHYLGRVLRVAPGAPVEAFDGDGHRASGVVAAVDGATVALDLGPPERADDEPPFAVVQAVALLKGDKLKEVVRQGTELGVRAFAPFIARYSDARALSKRRLARLRTTALEAARQSGRSVVPEVRDPVPLGSLALEGRVLVADPGAATTVRDALADSPAGPLVLVTGPEGGFDETEVAALVAAGATPVGLGRRVLRAETAPLALLAAVLVPEAL